MQELHPIVAKAIKLSGKSQPKLAKRVGCSQQTISKMLHREIPVSAEFALRISDAVGRQIPPEAFRPDLPWPPNAPTNPSADDTARHDALSSADPTSEILKSQAVAADQATGVRRRRKASGCPA